MIPTLIETYPLKFVSLVMHHVPNYQRDGPGIRGADCTYTGNYVGERDDMELRNTYMVRKYALRSLTLGEYLSRPLFKGFWSISLAHSWKHSRHKEPDITLNISN